jgi:hypothetical protein
MSRIFEVDANASVFVYNEPVHLGRGYAGLSAIVELNMKGKPESGNCFVFLNARRTSLKVLYYNNGGLCIFCKRLTGGMFNFNKRKMTLDEMQRAVNEVVYAAPQAAEGRPSGRGAAAAEVHF